MGTSEVAHDPSGPSGHLPIADSAMGRKYDQATAFWASGTTLSTYHR